MFYSFLYPLSRIFSPFNVFRYISFRAAYAAITSLILMLFVGPWFIRMLKKAKIRHSKGEEKLKFHLHKLGTPTMGGLLILITMAFSLFLWGNFTNRLFWVAILSTFFLSLIGWTDDYLKLTNRSYRGLPGRFKITAQFIVALGVGCYLYYNPITATLLWKEGTSNFGHAISLPFLKGVLPDLGIFYIPFVAIVIVGTSNAVNLTDGLDGLATGCILFAALAFAGITYIVGHANFSRYLMVPFIHESGELTVFIAAMGGACLGFLWYNAHPAQIFMGDTGSIPLGGALGTIAVLVKQELLLVIVGGIFVIEAGSVILQTSYFKYTRKKYGAGRRIFLMTPIHHHFQMKGWEETKIVIRFWIISGILALVTLSTFKLR